MNHDFHNGVWPVMLTPFTEETEIDEAALEELIEWYLNCGSAGLFAVCQSSEMFLLSLEERVRLARRIVEAVHGRVPVIASGHVSYSLSEQIQELQRMSDTGVDALILISNRLAFENESDDVFLRNLESILRELPESLPLGFYECPYPYKRILSEEVIRFCAQSGRFYFLKDTSCSMSNIRRKLALLQGSKMKLFNANTSTLLESLRAGAAGFSGVMANYHPELYVWLCRNWEKHPEMAGHLQGILTMCSLLELKNYPASAKYYLHKERGLSIAPNTRKNACDCVTQTEQLELLQLREISEVLTTRLKDNVTF